MLLYSRETWQLCSPGSGDLQKLFEGEHLIIVNNALSLEVSPELLNEIVLSLLSDPPPPLQAFIGQMLYILKFKDDLVKTNIVTEVNKVDQSYRVLWYGFRFIETI